MQLIKEKTYTQVKAENYSISFYNKGHKTLLSIPGKRFHYMLPLLGACNTVEKLDFTKSTSPFSFNKKNVLLKAQSILSNRRIDFVLNFQAP